MAMTTTDAPSASRQRMPSADQRPVLAAVALYLAWVLATFLLEGRTNLLQRPDPLGRAAYAVVANIGIGAALGAWVLQRMIAGGRATADQAGFRPLGRTLIAALVGAILGSGLFLLQLPGSPEPLVMLNVFAQALPTSIAEVMVCWAVVGVAVESATRRWGRPVSVGAGLVTAAVLFGVYHFAHSPPFNQPALVVFLTIIGIGTGLVYFLGRDIYATAIVHNFLASVGIIGGAELVGFRQALYPLYILAVAAVLVLVGAHALLINRPRPHRSAGVP